jgi:hypothetical protein
VDILVKELVQVKTMEENLYLNINQK